MYLSKRLVDPSNLFQSRASTKQPVADRNLRRYNKKMRPGTVDMATGTARLKSYAREKGHANPKTKEVWLTWNIGLWVGAVRKRYRDGKLTEQEIEALITIGLKLNPPYRISKREKQKQQARERRVQRMMVKLHRLDAYHQIHGHINVKQTEILHHFPNAGRWITYLRTLRRHGTLPSEIETYANRHNIDWDPNLGRKVKTKTNPS